MKRKPKLQPIGDRKIETKFCQTLERDYGYIEVLIHRYDMPTLAVSFLNTRIAKMEDYLPLCVHTVLRLTEILEKYKTLFTSLPQSISKP